MRPGWCRNAAIKRISKACVEALKRAGRRKVLIWGSASAKIMGDSFLGGQRQLLLTVNLPSMRLTAEESLSLRITILGTKVQRNFKTGASGSEADVHTQTGWDSSV